MSHERGEKTERKVLCFGKKMSAEMSSHERAVMKKILFFCPEMEKMAKEVEMNDSGASLS